MLDSKDVLEYYSREEVQKLLLELGKGREVVGVFGNGGFGTRPNVILYPDDIMTMVRKGVQEFHSSLERWSNPMGLRADSYEDLRVGWDLILDLDCKDFRHAKLAAGVLFRELEAHGLKAISLKYTGGKGFHLGIPWESMPKELNRKGSVNMFPDVPRQIGLYLKERIRERMERGLLKLNNTEELAEISGKDIGRIVTEEGIDPFQIVDIDPVLISPRHLFRMPYSLNKGTGYVSLPIGIRDLEGFEKEHAHPRGLRFRKTFLKPGEEGEASGLFVEAMDWWFIWKKKVERVSEERRVRPSYKVPESVFPPCMKNISMGLPDGRKRSVFMLINFLRSCNWTWKDVEDFIYQWNARNQPPLNENYIRGQLRWSKARKKTVPPAGCGREDYESIGVCKPDLVCGGSAKTIKNPAAYPFRKSDSAKKHKKLSDKVKKRGPAGPPASSGMY